MRDLYNRWWNTVSKGDKVFALVLIVCAAYEIATLMINPSWGNVRDAIVWSAFAYAAIGFDYYRALWHKHEPAAVLGAKLAHNLHIFGDHIIQKKEGGEFTIVPLGTGRSDTATRDDR